MNSLPTSASPYHGRSRKSHLDRDGAVRPSAVQRRCPLRHTHLLDALHGPATGILEVPITVHWDLAAAST